MRPLKPKYSLWIHSIIILCNGDVYINVNQISGDHAKISNWKMPLRR